VGAQKTWNAQGLSQLIEIIRGTGSFKKVTSDGLSFIEKRLPDGRGVRLNLDHTFKGFID
jgi:filamentous hemagglutinin